MSTQPRATLIYNPNAGFDDWQRHVEDVAAFWRARGWAIELANTRFPGHATELAAAAAAAGHSLVLTAGGDGTIHEAANGLIGTDAILVPLPAGTTNCLTRDLGLPKPDDGNPDWLVDASRRLLAGQVHTMDVGQCSNGQHWLLWAGVGIESAIVRFVEPRSPMLKRLGLAGYFAKATPAFLTYFGGHTRVTVDDQTIEGDLISVTICNSRLFAGGLYNLNPHGILDDGLVEVWILPGRFPTRMLWHSLFLLTHTHERRPDIFCLQGRHVIIETVRPQAYHLDGELNYATPITCTLLPSAIRILAPDTAPADLFVGSGIPMRARCSRSRSEYSAIIVSKNCVCSAKPLW